MLTDKDLLKLAGNLAIACKGIINSNVKNLGSAINLMEKALNEYNNAIMQATDERSKTK